MRSVEVVTQMPGAALFLVLDAKSSFWQIKLDHKSSMLTTFSTPCGSYRFLRMPFAVCLASEVFQHSMEQLFADYQFASPWTTSLSGVVMLQEHDANLKKVLDRAREINL